MKKKKTTPYEGEFWGVKRKYPGRFKFSQRAGRRFVSYWDFDIRWGKRRLYELTEAANTSSGYAFATWHFGKSVVHFIFKMNTKSLTVEIISILPKSQYHIKESFRKL